MAYQKIKVSYLVPILYLALVVYLSLQPVKAQENNEPSMENSNTRVNQTDQVSRQFSDAIARIDARLENVEFSERTFSRQMTQYTWVVSIASGFVVALGVGATFLFGRSLSNTREEIEKTLRVLVTQELMREGQVSENFNELVEKLRDAERRYENICGNLDELDRYNQLLSGSHTDPTFSYQEASKLEVKARSQQLTRDERRTVQGHLNVVISKGLDGTVDPNTLFNSSVVGGRLDFDEEAIKLAVLANHFNPAPSHSIYLAEMENTFGLSYRMDGTKMIQRRADPSLVREQARKKAIVEVIRAPREGCEQIYSRANNIAVREREVGQFSKLIDAIETSIDPSSRKDALSELEDAAEMERSIVEDSSLTSYALVTLADAHAMRGEPGWRENFLKYARKAIETVATESPMSTWYYHTLRNLNRSGERVGLGQEISAFAEEWSVDLSQTDPEDVSERMQAALLQELAARMGQDGHPPEPDIPSNKDSERSF